ncbi:MAG: hypothetical protein RIG61_10750 [Deltaproteobacteria bacterium]
MVTRQQKKGTGRRKDGGEKKRGGQRKEPEINLADLGKAGEHFIVGATEMVVGTGFAIKGVKELLEKEEGRKFVCELPFKAVNKGFDLVRRAGEQVRERRKSGAAGSSGKRNRKIDVE